MLPFIFPYISHPPSLSLLPLSLFPLLHYSLSLTRPLSPPSPYISSSSLSLLPIPKYQHIIAADLGAGLVINHQHVMYMQKVFTRTDIHIVHLNRNGFKM